MDTGIDARQVEWIGRPRYYVAGTICLVVFTFTLYRPTSNAFLQNRGYWHCFHQVHLNKASNQLERSDVYPPPIHRHRLPSLPASQPASLPGMTDCAIFRQKHSSMLPQTKSSEFVLLLHAFRGLATGLMLCSSSNVKLSVHVNSFIT